MSFSHYQKIKDKVCIYYEGHATEYLVQLRMLRPFLEETFSGIEITYACRPEYLNKAGKAISLKEYWDNTISYACALPIIYDCSSIHPILKLVLDSEVKIKKFPIKGSIGNDGVICGNGFFPTINLDETKINKVKNWVKEKKFNPVIDAGFDNAGIVVGVECDKLFEAVEAGIPTALVDTGVGKQLYEMLCENPIILKI